MFIFNSSKENNIFPKIKICSIITNRQTDKCKLRNQLTISNINQENYSFPIIIQKQREQNLHKQNQTPIYENN